MDSAAAPRGVGAPRLHIIHLASGNAHKAQEFQRLADSSALGLRVVPAKTMPAVVEDTGTFIGNARKKAMALQAILPADAWVLADDSGVCVDALGGAPGVESAYFAGPAADPDANLAKLIDVMRAVPEGQRAGQFVCVLLLRGPGGVEQIFEGRCSGVLRREAAGARGFGYDPIFVPDGSTCTYAELTDEVKNAVSHRGRAWRLFAQRWREMA